VRVSSTTIFLKSDLFHIFHTMTDQPCQVSSLLQVSCFINNWILYRIY
jgi:hypothetical protein